MNQYYNDKRLPEYYDTMYLDGYSADEVYVAFHRSLQKRVLEMQKKQQLENQIEKELEQQINEKLDKALEKGLRKKLCKQYLTTLDKAKITGISLI